METVDLELSRDQWEALKTLRRPAPALSPGHRRVVQSLIELGLVSNGEGFLALTPRGRQALVRGTPALLDLAA
jgi:hypothetical protein